MFSHLRFAYHKPAHLTHASPRLPRVVVLNAIARAAAETIFLRTMYNPIARTVSRANLADWLGTGLSRAVKNS
jgi:hypothetical protein